jgi:protein-S-isoprenylcysteine O-methyltransferase Ste14
MMKTLHVVLRPAMAICLSVAQLLSYLVCNRTWVLSESPYLLSLGVALMTASVLLWASASVHCQRAVSVDELATSGPFQYVRHPIYVSVYLLCAGLGFAFFTWLHFLVLAVFIPLWWLECKREEEEMREKYGTEYVAYQERTDMFIPRVL